MTLLDDNNKYFYIFGRHAMIKKILFLSLSLIASAHAMDNPSTNNLRDWVQKASTVTVILQKNREQNFSITDQSTIGSLKLTAIKTLFGSWNDSDRCNIPVNNIRLVAARCGYCPICNHYSLAIFATEPKAETIIKLTMSTCSTDTFALVVDNKLITNSGSRKG